MSAKHVVVIGAGIVGAATALWLRRAGLEVTLLDRGEPGMGASYGNACLLASCAIVPVTTPGLIRKAPGYLFDPKFPLFLRWGHLPRMLPWLARYLGHANDAETRRISEQLAHIIGDSLQQHQALTAGTRAAKWVRECDYSFVYRDRAAFEADAYGWELRRQAGFVPEIIEGQAVREVEPILGPEAGLLAVNKNHGFILNPAHYVQDLVALLKEMGGQFVQAEVQDFALEGGRIAAVDTNQGRFVCDRAVISSGVWSKSLMQKLGLNIPLEAERGYHVLFKNPSQSPNNPMMISDAKFVATPMDQGLRCAGVVEFGGLTEKRSKAPLALLRSNVKRFFPEMKAEAEEEWLGFRPAPTDSLPLIGEVGATGVFTAFGHHHVGLTGGAKTGRIVADLIAGKAPNLDLAPYAPDRFKGRMFGGSKA